MIDYAYEMTWGRALVRSVRQYPDKIAVQDDRASLTYRQFNERVNRLANALKNMDLKKGDRLATLSGNCLELMEIYLASLKIGVIPCPLDIRGLLEDQLVQMEIVKPGMLVFHQDMADRVQELVKKKPDAIPTVVLGTAEGLPVSATAQLIGQGSSDEPVVTLHGDDVAFILFTGGTTGTPKGVMLTHLNLIWNAVNVIGENGSPSPESRIYYPMQIYHSGALSRFLASLYAGGTFIATKTFDPAAYLDAVERERCTFAVGNTAIWSMLLEEGRRRRRDTRSITSWLHAQGDITPEFHDEIKGVLFPNGLMYASYALTEAAPGVTVLKPQDQPRKWPGIGRPYMTMEARLVDDQDQDVPVGETGQILLRGPTIMKGYYNNPEETAATMAGGWLHTGDIGSVDDLGFLYFEDRLKDVIKSGGLNIFGREVEKVLVTHPGVQEAAVIGVPHPKWGETVRAVVVPRPGQIVTPEEIIDHCKSRLASHKKPTSVVFAESLPKGSFGSKVLKKILRDQFGQPQ
jgi:fatty-acyl-CoA synthase